MLQDLPSSLVNKTKGGVSIVIVHSQAVGIVFEPLLQKRMHFYVSFQKYVLHECYETIIFAQVARSEALRILGYPIMEISRYKTAKVEGIYIHT